MRIGIDLDDVILEKRTNRIINGAQEDFRILRAWAGSMAVHEGKHQLICITARPFQYMMEALSALYKARIIFDEYHFIGGRHKQVVHVDYLIDNSLVVKKQWTKFNDPKKFILFWSKETGTGVKTLLEAIDEIQRRSGQQPRSSN